MEPTHHGRCVRRFKSRNAIASRRECWRKEIYCLSGPEKGQKSYQSKTQATETDPPSSNKFPEKEGKKMNREKVSGIGS